MKKVTQGAEKDHSTNGHQNNELKYGCLKLRIPKEESFIYYSSYFLDVYGRVKLHKGDILIDAGANVGDYTLKAAKKVGSDGLVIALEPNPNNLILLKENIKNNSIKNVVVLPFALSNMEGNTLIFGEGGTSCVKKVGSGEGYRVGTIKLETVIKDFVPNGKNFSLKMDIEGSEKLVFEDPEFLSRIDQIAIELHGSENISSITTILRSFGFNIRNYKRTDQVVGFLKNLIKHPLSLIRSEYTTKFLAIKGIFRVVSSRRTAGYIGSEQLKVIYAVRTRTNN